MKGLIINVDNNSPDNTKDAFLNTKTGTEKQYITTAPGVKGKGNNFYNLFKACTYSGAKAVVVVDADLKSITPEWVNFLATPVLESYDFVTPLYSRHKYDGTITNNIMYPLIYGLLGKNIRQPIGGDFAFSPRLAEHWLNQEWTETTRQYGIDNFMTSHALFGGFKVCQAGLGAKIHKVSQPKLNEMFIQVVTTFFDTILSNHKGWLDVELLEEIPTYGLKKMDKPQKLEVDCEEMKRTATYEFFKNRPLLRNILSEGNYLYMNRCLKEQAYDIDHDRWARTVYDLIASYSRAGSKAEVIEAIKPLYFARIVSFVNDTIDYGHERAEDEIRLQAECFRKHKPYLCELLAKSRPQSLESPARQGQTD